MSVEPKARNKYALNKSIDEGAATAKVYVRTPDNKVLSFAETFLTTPVEAGKAILTNCVLGGDKAVMNDEKLFKSVAMECIEFIEFRAVSKKTL